MRRTLHFLAVTIMTACSSETSGPGGSTGSTTSGTGGSGGALAITGTLIDTWRNDDGDVVLRRDPALVTLSALVQRSDGGWDTYPGSLDAAGLFVIPDVPLGTAHVVVHSRDGGRDRREIRVTAARTLDLGWVRYGRPDAVTTGDPTSIALQIEGGASWDLTSSWEAVDSLSANVHAVGNCTSSLDGCAVSSSDGGLIDASKGDRTWFTHHASTTSGTTIATHVTHAFRSTTFTQQASGTSTLSGTAELVPQRQLAFACDVVAFASLLDDAPPGSAFQDFSVGVGSADRTLTELGAVFRGSPGDGAFDLTYGDPDGAAKLAWISAQTRAPAAPVPGFPMPADLVFSFRGTPASFAAQTVVPPVSAPREIRVDGQPAYPKLPGVGPSPVIAWKAPAVGSAPLYHLTLFTPTIATIDVFTRDTQVAIPAELLGLDDVTIWIAAEIGDYATDLQASAQVTYAGGFTR